MSSVCKRVVGAALSIALATTPVVASAASVPSRVQTINPMVAVSLLGSPASAAALCGAQAATAASTTPPSGCVLPVTDLPPPVVQQPAPPPLAELPPPGPRFGIAPLLFGLAGIGALVALLLIDDDDDEEPVSPN